MSPDNERDHQTPLCTHTFYSGTLHLDIFWNKVNICATKMDCTHGETVRTKEWNE